MTRAQYQDLSNRLGCALILLTAKEPQVAQAVSDLRETAKVLTDIWTKRPDKKGRGRNRIVEDQDG